MSYLIQPITNFFSINSSDLGGADPQNFDFPMIENNTVFCDCAGGTSQTLDTTKVLTLGDAKHINGNQFDIWKIPSGSVTPVGDPPNNPDEGDTNYFQSDRAYRGAIAFRPCCNVTGVKVDIVGEVENFDKDYDYIILGRFVLNQFSEARYQHKYYFASPQNNDNNGKAQINQTVVIPIDSSPCGSVIYIGGGTGDDRHNQEDMGYTVTIELL